MLTINIIFSHYKVSWSFKQSFEVTTNAFEEVIVPTNHYNVPNYGFTNISCSYTDISFLSGASPIYLVQIKWFVVGSVGLCSTYISYLLAGLNSYPVRFPVVSSRKKPLTHCSVLVANEDKEPI